MDYFGWLEVFFKKKKEEKKDLQTYDQEVKLPEYPKPSFEVPREKPKHPAFAKIEQEFEMSDEDLGIPQRKKRIEQVKFVPQRPVFEVPKQFDRKPQKMHQEKPLFVKMDTYKEAIEMIEKVKEQLQQIDHTLNELNRIKREEDQELDAWHQELGKIKDQLLALDKKLFQP